jgi:hypothetical protein
VGTFVGWFAGQHRFQQTKKTYALDNLRHSNNSVAAWSNNWFRNGRLNSYSPGHRHHHGARQLHFRTQAVIFEMNACSTHKQTNKTIMNKIVSLALLVGGVILIVLGVTATNSFSSDVSKFFTGSPTDKAIWMLIGGIVAVVVGLGGSLRGSKGS